MGQTECLSGECVMKCPVCDWEIKDKGITVTVGGKPVVVCCEDCAEKLRKKAKSSKER